MSHDLAGPFSAKGNRLAITISAPSPGGMDSCGVELEKFHRILSPIVNLRELRLELRGQCHVAQLEGECVAPRGIRSGNADDGEAQTRSTLGA